MAYLNTKQLMSNCENPAAYDFTLECDHEDYKALPPIERFLAYKSTAVGEQILSDIKKGEPDERTAENCYHEAAEFCVDNCRKYPDLTDGDGWDGKCGLAVNLYEQLWGWKEGEQRSGSSISRTVEPFGALGGDTLNSVQTTLNCYLEAVKDEQEIYRQQLLSQPKNPKVPCNVSTRFGIQLYRIFGKDFIEQLAGKEELSCFIQHTHTMGNLALVPAGYNRYRGRAAQIHDYADLSLYNLFHNCDGKSGFLGEDEETRKRNSARYINFLFLWDYVKKTENGTYEVRPLCDSHKMKMQTWTVMDKWDGGNVVPKKEELEELCRNINNKILRRGRFMTAMLEISIQYPNIYTFLMQEVFLTDRVYEGFGEVIETIEEKLHASELDFSGLAAMTLTRLDWDMEKDWMTNLQEEFPFMRRKNIAEKGNTYRRYGFQCIGGWYSLLKECCEAITARYTEDGIGMESIDFEPAQIKEKFGTLRFYYGYHDAPCGLAAFDFLGSGVSMRFAPGKEDDDDAAKKLRRDIAQIVKNAEEKSKHTCEVCGAEGVLRDDREHGIYWVQTLCDTCHENRINYRKDPKNTSAYRGRKLYEDIKKMREEQPS